MNGISGHRCVTDHVYTAGEKRSVEGRCDGLSVQFQAAKIIGGCGKHVSKSTQKADRQQHPAEDQLESAEAVDPSFGLAQIDGAHIHMPGARRSLAGHHDKHSKKHSKKGNHDDDEDEDSDSKDGDSEHKQHTKQGAKHSDKHCHMTFEDAEGKPCIGCCFAVDTINDCTAAPLAPHCCMSGGFAECILTMPISLICILKLHSSRPVSDISTRCQSQSGAGVV